MAVSLAKCVTIFLCSFGVIYQCYYICDIYYMYRTLIKITLDEASHLTTPGFSACFRLVDVMMKDQVDIRKGFKFYLRNDINFTWKDSFEKQSRLTVEDIFDLTPPASKFFSDQGKGCMIRHGNDRIVSILKSEECYQYFNITKYFHREFICYKIMPKKAIVLKGQRFNFSPHNFNTIYEIYLNQGYFKHVQYFTSYVHQVDSIDFFDSFYSNMMKQDIKHEIDIRPKINMNYFMFHLIRLKPPYDTDCQDFPIHRTFTECFLAHINSEAMKVHNKVIPERFTHERYNLSIFNTLDYNNRTVGDQLDKIERKYSYIWKSTCQWRMIITDSSLSYRSTAMSFSISWPNKLFVHREHYPQQTMLDLIIYICSSIGIWIGVSVFSFFNILSDKLVNQNHKNKIRDANDKQAKTIKQLISKNEELELHVSRLQHKIDETDNKQDRQMTFILNLERRLQ